MEYKAFPKQFAVKYFSPALRDTESPSTLAFDREFKALRELNHPCVVRVYGFEPATSTTGHALVMKFMPTGSLADVLDRVEEGKPPDFWNDTGIAIIVCGIVVGFEFIHSKDIVHRDVKPANILIDRRGRSRITDLGSSKFIQGAAKLSKEYRGTCCYQAPEMYKEDPYTSKVDVFSFALILYEILVGQPVFPPTHSPNQIMRRVFTGVRADFPSNMNDEVKLLISRGWAEKPSGRPTFGEILSDLRRIHFKILPGVKTDAVEEFLCDIDHRQNQETGK
jgi:serine/threonine protein kinase